MHTWYLYNRTVAKVHGEQVSIKGGTHEYDTDVRALGQQVLQYHDQEVTEKEKKS